MKETVEILRMAYGRGAVAKLSNGKTVFVKGGIPGEMCEIEILEEEYAGQAPMNVLVSNMSDKYDMSEEKVDEMVRNLKHKGVIYEPTNGYLKRA
jgi:tRNA/tmRNA/rRNA uracil-C5-methylase (TrmA/RlmC/RlmD family)